MVNKISKATVAFILAFPILFWGHVASAGDLEKTTKQVAGVIFSELEQGVIKEYYRRKYGEEIDHHDDGYGKHKRKGKSKKKGLPPGLAKKDKLPPGLARQLHRNGRLPPGLEKRGLPDDLDSRLPTVREGYERVLADGKVILVETASGIIVDIIEDVLGK